MQLVVLENAHWQLGVLPEVGGSIAFGRVRYNGIWLDVLRPTAEADYSNPSKCSSFVMLPWANRLRAGKFAFDGQRFQLKTTPDDGTARHGDVRKRPWHIEQQTSSTLLLSFSSWEHESINFPFAFTGVMDIYLDGACFSIRTELRNADARPMPGGFGYHPYFVLPDGANYPLLEIPCERYFDLGTDGMPTGSPLPVPPALDYRTLRPLGEAPIDSVLTGRDPDAPVRLRYPAWGLTLTMNYSPAYRHVVLYRPSNEASVAIEPMTIAPDGFNMAARGIAGHGMAELRSGEALIATLSMCATRD